jgi:DHA2 family multidrug resistance protein
MMLAIVPITNVALGTLNPNMLKNASGLFNLMRNLGGAIGLATINTVLNNRTDLQLMRLHEAVNWSCGPAVDTFNHLVAQLSDFGADAKAMALIFLILSLLFVTLAALAIVMKRPTPATGEIGAH